MNKKLQIFITAFLMTPLFSAGAAVSIKKATPVASSNSAGSSSVSSLAPNVIGLVSGVMELNAKQNAISAECEPTTSEMNFVDNTMKEWAKTGQVSSKEIQKTMSDKKRLECPESDYDKGYANDLAAAKSTGRSPCYNYFSGPGNDNMVWKGFPKTGKGTYCKDGDLNNCSGKNRVFESDTYDLFNMIDFGPADFTQSETTMAAKLLNKVETCSSSKLSAKKKALWGEFLVNTAGGLGKKTDTGSIMQQVGSISNSGGVGAIGSLGTVASQLMNK